MDKGDAFRQLGPDGIRNGNIFCNDQYILGRMKNIRESQRPVRAFSHLKGRVVYKGQQLIERKGCACQQYLAFKRGSQGLDIVHERRELALDKGTLAQDLCAV